jgi:hypothetical protein
MYTFSYGIDCPNCNDSFYYEYETNGNATNNTEHKCSGCGEWLFINIEDNGHYDEDGNLDVSVEVHLYTEYYGEPKEKETDRYTLVEYDTNGTRGVSAIHAYDIVKFMEEHPDAVIKH